MKHLKIKDLIFIGIYTAIYFFVIFVCTMALMLLIPGFSSLFIPSVVALFSGLVYLLLTQKIPRFGAITIMGSMMGLFFLLSGHFPLAFIFDFIFALTADLVLYKINFSDKIRTTISYVLFSFNLMGPVLPLWFMKNAYVSSLVARGKSQAYIDKLFAPITSLGLVSCVAGTILCSLIGLYVGKKLYVKHFEKEKSNVYD
jgi:energy-coupling factor transport system substrate-specific component